MNPFRLLGIGDKKIIGSGREIAGVVTDVKKCWWIKVNTKAVRAHALDGALFPHIVYYRYSADGREYAGSRMISAFKEPPRRGETIRVFYDGENPSRSAVLLP